MATKKANPSWTDVKAKLAEVDRADLLGMVQDLYAGSKDNQAFLHARLRLGDDVLKPYKATIARWLWPDVFKNQDISVAKAKKAIADYKKARGNTEGLAELMVFYCEQALKTIVALPATQRPALWARLNAVRDISHGIGYGVGENMGDLLAEHGIDD